MTREGGVPTAEEARAILENRNAALIRQQTGKDPARLTETEYQEALQAAYDRVALDRTSCFEDGRFVPGRFAQTRSDHERKPLTHPGFRRVVQCAVKAPVKEER